MAAQRKLDLNKVLRAIDNKDYDFYDKMTDEERKEFGGVVFARWASSVGADWKGRNAPAPEIIEYYLRNANHVANKHMFDLSRHPKLQWQMIAAVSPGIGTFHHQWIKQKPKPKNANAPIKKELLRLFPAMKEDDIDVLSKLITKRDLNKFIKDHGD